MDVLTPEQRHYNMSQIHSKDTKPELIVRRWLWRHGYRYRLHGKDLPGKPDIVLPKYNAVIFVHGCFWHRHNCKYASTPATRRDFWEKKLNGNIKRDQENIKKLKKNNWRVLVIWECEIKTWNSLLEKKINNFLHLNEEYYNEIYDYPPETVPAAAEQEPDYGEEKSPGHQ
ncbi:MAG: very short patch repair endonuclease [Bacteroidales bacterium]|jgi:DNA mismatch endonuclease (patch repair protein)|nr:very short patch repair endonuclease [Bacteroidales bacterium]